MSIKKAIILSLSLVIITLGLSISLQSLLAGWSPPAANPPNQNVSAPINESTQTQSKDGTLVFRNTLNNPNSLLIATGTLSIGTLFPNNSYLLDVNGSINAKKVCIAGNCKTNWIDVSPWVLNGTSLYYNGGNVGIGTNNPLYKLQVEGHLKSSGIIEGQSLRILEQTTGAYGVNPENMLTQLMAATNDFWKIYGEGPANAGQLVIETGNDKTEPIVFRQRKTGTGASYRDSMAISGAGNVGIGTTNPGAPLTVMQTVAGLSTGLQFSGQHTPGVTAGGVINSFDSDGTTIRPLSLQTNGGNVGIGITSPAQKLEVGGKVLADDFCLRSDPTKCLDSGGSDDGVPDGTIVMWSGTLASIPSGWVLCDGLNGTPDLRDKFVVGAKPASPPGGIGNISVAHHDYGGSGGAPNVSWYDYNRNSYDASPYYLRLAYIMKTSISGDIYLVNGVHSKTNCLAAGGIFVPNGTNNFCRFNSRSSCISGWTQYSNWRTTSANPCTGTDLAGCSGMTTATTTFHSWANIAVETAIYYNEYISSGSTWNPTYYCSWSNCSEFCSFGSQCSSVDMCSYSLCYDESWNYLGMGSCSLDSSNTYGCGTSVPYSDCATSAATCYSNIQDVGCY